MGNFRQGGRAKFDRGRRSGGNRFGGGFRGGDRDSRRSEMHDATCSKCGKRCQVPFRPTGSRPVFCSDCFRQNEDGRTYGSPSHNRTAQTQASPNELNQINAKLDKIIAILSNLELDVDEEGEEEYEDSDDEDDDSEDDSEDE